MPGGEEDLHVGRHIGHHEGDAVAGLQAEFCGQGCCKAGGAGPEGAVIGNRCRALSEGGEVGEFAGGASEPVGDVHGAASMASRCRRAVSSSKQQKMMRAGFSAFARLARTVATAMAAARALGKP